MASLYYVTEGTKTLVKWTIIGIGCIIGLVILLQVIGLILKAATPPPPPTVTFGPLPPVVFPESKIQKQFTYQINTVSGTLPTFQNKVAVYKIIAPQPSLLSLKNAEDTATNIGFPAFGIPIDEMKYQWTSSRPPVRTLKFNIFSYNFTIESDFRNDPEILEQRNGLPEEKIAVEKVSDLLNALPAPPKDIEATMSATQYLQISGDKLVKATSPSTAQIVQVTLKQNPIDSIPIVYPYALMNFYLAPTAGHSAVVVEATYIHQTVDTENTWATEAQKTQKKVPATYPIITSEQAFKQLTDGKAFISQYYGANNQININEVSLGYYIGETTQQYIYPVYVFQGDDDFVAYVSALDPKWFQK